MGSSRQSGDALGIPGSPGHEPGLNYAPIHLAAPKKEDVFLPKDEYFR